jgi:hypothetical protein
MDGNKNNYIDLSKIIKPKVNEEEPIHYEPTLLSELFKKPSDNNPVERQKAREALFREARDGGKSNKNTPTSSTFTK